MSRLTSLTLTLAVVIGTLLADVGRAVAAPASQAPAPKSITVLTYNTHLFKDSSADYVGQKFSKSPKPIVFDDDNRRKHIAAHIGKCGADIVALQEVWAYKWQDSVIKELRKAYPYSYRAKGIEGRFDWDWSWDVIREVGKTSSGLVLLSKYKLKDAQFHPFPDKRSKKDNEGWATKGVITATVEPWPGGPTFRVGITHACTDAGGSGQPDIQDLVAKTVGTHQSPAIMMGDLNVNETSKPGDYERMQTIFGKFGATDAYVKVHRKKPGLPDDGSFTANGRSNLLYRIFSSGQHAPTRLDYVFVKESGPRLTLIPEKADVIRNWTYPVRSFTFTAKKHIEDRIFVLKTDEGLPVKMMVRVVDHERTKWKRNAVLEIQYAVYHKEGSVEPTTGVARLGPRVDWKGKNRWIESGLDFDSGKVTTSGLLTKYPGGYPPPNDVTASAHKADFKLTFNEPYAHTVGNHEQFHSLDQKGIAQLLTGAHSMDLSDHYPLWVKFKAVRKSDPPGQRTER